MIPKIVMAGSFAMDEAIFSIIPLHSRGIDAGWLQKRAAAPLFDFTKLGHDPKKTFVHLIALGDGEWYGCNRNGDYFGKQANDKYHDTFVKHGHYYHNHKNKDPEKKFGDIEMSAHNDDMHRVELVIGMLNDKCAEDLSELEKKGELPVSMACKVPWDECSICHNRAKSKDEYCKHAMAQLTDILPDGRQVYVDNVHPDFFDLSKVWKPADRIAWTLSKAASGAVISGAELAEQMGVIMPSGLWVPSIYASSKRDILQKMAQAPDAQLLAMVKDALHLTPLSAEDIAALREGNQSEDVLGALHDAHVLLPLESMVKVCGKDDVSDSDIEDAKLLTPGAMLKSILSKVTDDLCSDSTYDGGKGSVTRKAKIVVIKIGATHGLDFPAVHARAVGNKLSGVKPPVAKGNVKSAADNATAQALANEYIKYALSFCQRASRSGDENALRNLTALHLTTLI